MAETIQITLPWPPSVNTYWRNIVIGGRARTIISAKGRAYRKAAVAAVHRDYAGPTLAGRMRVSVDLYPPTLRKFDVDNHLKAPLDAITHAGLWDDDSQVDRLEVLRCPKDPHHPRVVVTLSEEAQ